MLFERVCSERVRSQSERSESERSESVRLDSVRSERRRSEHRRAVLKGAAAWGSAALLPAWAQPAGRSEVSDDLGRRVALSLPLRRVVIFNRYTTEFVRGIGAMDAVVGVDIDASRHRAYWPTVTPAMLAGTSGTSLNYEAIVGMQPDAVLMPRNSDWQRAEKLLAGFGIPVVVVTAWDYLKHEFNVELLGRLFGQPVRARALNDYYRGWRQRLDQRMAGVVRKRVYFEEVGDWRSVLKGSGWHDMIEAGGGHNVFGDVALGDLSQSAASSPRGSVNNFSVDPEEVLARRPDVIIKLQPGQYEPHPREFSREVLERVARRPGFAALPGVQAGHVHHISYYLAGGCSKITGALQVAKWLHPQRMAGLDPDQAMDEWLTRFQGVAGQRGYAVSLSGLRA